MLSPRSSPPLPSLPATHPLNFSEHAYAMMDGLVGSMTQVYLLRLDAPLQAVAVRAVWRELLSTQPRLRAIADPGPWCPRLRVLPDNAVVDELFELAWEEVRHLDVNDAQALEALHNRLLNEVLPLEHGLALRVRFVPDAQTPVLFVSVHHALLDGKSILHVLSQFMQRINGGPALVFQPVESPSLWGAICPAHFWQWPARLWRSRGHAVRQARQHAALNVQQVLHGGQAFLSTHALMHHRLACSASELRTVARALGLSLNSMVTLVLAETFLAQAPGDPLAAAVVRQSVDLRRYHRNSAAHGPLWGNHVGAFLVTEVGPQSLQARAASIRAQNEEGLARFERREMFWLYAFYEALPWLGRNLVAWAATQMVRTGKFPRISCHATSLGKASALNPPGAAVRLTELVPAAPSLSLLQAVVELDDALLMPVMWPLGHASRATMRAHLARVDATAQRLLDQARSEGLLPSVPGAHTAAAARSLQPLAVHGP